MLSDHPDVDELLRAVICQRCGDDAFGPWVPVNDGRFLCEACWEKRTT